MLRSCPWFTNQRRHRCLWKGADGGIGGKVKVTLPVPSLPGIAGHFRTRTRDLELPEQQEKHVGFI